MLVSSSALADETWVFAGYQHYVDQCGCVILVPVWQRQCIVVPEETSCPVVIPIKVQPKTKPVQHHQVPLKIVDPPVYDPIPVKKNIEDVVYWKPEATFARTVSKKTVSLEIVAKK